MRIEPYLFFNGRCEEALEFYRKAVGAEIGPLMLYRDSPEFSPDMLPPDAHDKVMHAAFRIGESTLMASDGHGDNDAQFEGFSLCLNADDAAQAKQWFDALSQGGKITMPLTKTFFSECFGMLVDRFGVGWMVIAEPK